MGDNRGIIWISLKNGIFPNVKSNKKKNIGITQKMYRVPFHFIKVLYIILPNSSSNKTANKMPV
jgi:hypothetical protein